MSESPIDAIQDPEQHAEELIAKAQEEKAVEDAQVEEILSAVESGEDFQVEKYEWVEFGGAELKVRTWLEGGLLDNIAVLTEDFDIEQMTGVKGALDLQMDLLVTQTEAIRVEGEEMEDDETIRAFWRRYVEKWGDKGMDRAAEVIQEPLEIEEDRRQRAIQNFRPA